ncbi:lipopolysaccharide biosynthesis protein [Protofrankia symbiont of Coriaria ruscifolia]|uniref:lipopolysaccharide biosynthesis protein n=1 Tax=Protofrankia symbiont of Coriaria ruscifolia TaxID=1306542 RepID=UPI0010416998|nr:lipopolysaccharide biosynthesis protein [Protofrankia symbiont of Coriaria ruscifolia]
MSRAAQPRAETERGLPRVSLLRILRRRWLAIVLAIIAGTAFVLIVSKQQAPQFEATGRVFLNTSDVAFGGGSDSVDATRVVQTQAQLAGSTAALDLISKQLKVPWRTVAKQVKVTASDEGYFFTIAGRDSTEEKSVRLVQVAEAAYQQLLAQYGANGSSTVNKLTERRDEISQNLRQLEAQQAALPRKADGQALAAQISNLDAQVTEFNRRISEVQVNAALSAASVTLAESAHSVGRVTPKLFRNVLAGALAALLLAVVVVWCAYLRRPTVLDGRAAADVLGVPLIADIPGGRGGGLPTDRLVAAMSSVLAPTGKVIALTPAGPGDLAPDLVAAVSANWSDDQGIVLILDASPVPDVRGALERLPPAVSGELPRWAHEPTCMARSSGGGNGHLLYNRVAPARAARPGGLAPILADRAPVVDLVIVLTPALVDLPMTAASAMQADAVIVVATGETRIKELSRVLRDWPALSERMVGVVHDGRPGLRRSTDRGAASSRGVSSPAAVARVAPSPGASRGEAAVGSANTTVSRGAAPAGPVPRPLVDAARRTTADAEATDRYARPTGKQS